MKISLQQVALLKKLMALTNSSNDAEALGAIRKANQIVGGNWDMFFNRTVSTDVGIHTEGNLADEIRKAFDEIRGNVSGSFKEFIDNIESTFNATNYLTAEQRRPLFNAVRQQRERRNRDE